MLVPPPLVVDRANASSTGGGCQKIAEMRHRQGGGVSTTRGCQRQGGGMVYIFGVKVVHGNQVSFSPKCKMGLKRIKTSLSAVGGGEKKSEKILKKFNFQLLGNYRLSSCGQEGKTNVCGTLAEQGPFY